MVGGGLFVRRIIDICTSLDMKLWWRFRSGSSPLDTCMKEICGRGLQIVSAECSHILERLIQASYLTDSRIDINVCKGEIDISRDRLCSITQIHQESARKQ